MLSREKITYIKYLLLNKVFPFKGIVNKNNGIITLAKIVFSFICNCNLFLKLQYFTLTINTYLNVFNFLDLTRQSSSLFASVFILVI